MPNSEPNETVKDVFDTFTKSQKERAYQIIGEVLEDKIDLSGWQPSIPGISVKQAKILDFLVREAKKNKHKHGS